MWQVLLLINIIQYYNTILNNTSLEKDALGLIVVELADPACMSWGNLLPSAVSLSVNVSYLSCLWCV